jgi:hypothetical protein
MVGAEAIELEVRRLGITVASLHTQANPGDTESLHRLLLGAVNATAPSLTRSTTSS